MPPAGPLCDLINRLGQGHRRNLDAPTLLALKQLRDEAFGFAGLSMASVVRDSGAWCGGSCERGFATNDEKCD
jgi:hypothetical protein